MIARYAGGESVPGGIYWSSGGEFVYVPAGGGRLAGGLESRYVRTPLPLVLIVGPLMGLAFVIVLPLAGLLVLVPFLVSRLMRAMGAGELRTLQAATTTMQPGVSFLEGTPRRSEPAEESDQMESHSGKLVDLASVIAGRRWTRR